ncbi:MAG: tRNA preQ1(34) S-adenosylmethionine ribosyltransferase-isomerase QueA [Candidatus Moraniibacteriota bacterium]
MNLSDLEAYDYALPEELIRREGIEPRDSARLFVYDTKTDTITHDFFSNLAKYLPERSLLVLNDTHVVPARLHLKKASGGKIEVFVLMNEWDGESNEIPVMVDRKCGVGWKLFFPNGYFFEVVRQEENRFYAILKPSNSLPESLRESLRAGGSTPVKSLEELLDEFGETPLPPYLKGEEWSRDEEVLRKRYQTIFAESGKSVAAPTAALHFTDRVFASLREKNIDTATVTLDVGLGTFAPLKEENFALKKLHREYVSIPQSTVDKVNFILGGRTSKLDSEPKIVVVGTTALRTIESATALRGSTSKCRLRLYEGETDIFITAPHHFEIPDILITNFHIPKSSLMLLVDAFLQDKGAKRNLVALYEEAIKEKYAFYSFGDSMLIL